MSSLDLLHHITKSEYESDSDDDDVITNGRGKKRKQPSRSCKQDQTRDTSQEEKKLVGKKKKKKQKKSNKNNETATTGKKTEQKKDESKQDAVEKKQVKTSQDVKMELGLVVSGSLGSSSSALQQQEQDETKKIIDQQLECPICFQFMDKAIYMCKEGHSICEACRFKHMSISFQDVNTILSTSLTCPTCRKTDSLDTRNRALEAIAAIRRVVCRFEGCGQNVTTLLRKSHEETCPFGYNLISIKLKKYIRYFTEQECLEDMTAFRCWNRRILGKQALSWMIHRNSKSCESNSSSYRNLARYKGDVVMTYFYRSLATGIVIINVFHYALPSKTILFKLYIADTPFSMSGQAASLRGPKMSKYKTSTTALCGMQFRQDHVNDITKITMAQYPHINIKQGDIAMIFHLFLFADKAEFDQFDVKKELEYMKPHMSNCFTRANTSIFTYDLDEPRLGAGHIVSMPNSHAKKEEKERKE